MPPGFKIAESTEFKLRESLAVEAKAIEWKAQPFVQPLIKLGSLTLGDVAQAPGLKSFIDIGERYHESDPQFSSPKTRYDRLTVDFRETRFALIETSASKVEGKNIPPLLVSTAVGLSAFFGFMGEALGGPATELILQGKKSPIKMKEGVPEPGNPNDLPHGKDYMGSAEAKMIGALVFITALPFIYGKAKRSYRTWKAEKIKQEVEAVSVSKEEKPLVEPVSETDMPTKPETKTEIIAPENPTL